MLGRSREPVTLMLGNHDMNAEGDHALGIYTQRDDWTEVQVCEEIGFSQTGRYISDHGYGFNDDFIPHRRRAKKKNARVFFLVDGYTQTGVFIYS